MWCMASSLLHPLRLLGAVCLLTLCPPLTQSAEKPNYQEMYASNFAAGIDKKISRQGVGPHSLQIVDAPGGRAGKCLRVTMSKDENFAKVANGAPRSELAFGRFFSFAPGHSYRVEWSTYLPPDHQFDSQQQMSLAQVHGGPNRGSPPFMLSLLGDHYRVDVRGAQLTKPHYEKFLLGPAAGDLGEWVTWRLEYRPDPTGAAARLRVFKNGQLFHESSSIPNAYQDDTEAYWKLGLYKWDWLREPSDVTTQTVYFGDFKVWQAE